MKRMTALLCAAALIGCAGGDDVDEQQAEDSAAAAMAPAPAPTLSLADVAGTWTINAMNETGDSVLTTYTLNAAAEPTGWTISIPNRDPIPVRVTVDADSIIFDTDPYESPVRSGVQVTTQGAGRLVDGKLQGAYTARYQVTTPDSVVRGRLAGTKNP